MLKRYQVLLPDWLEEYIKYNVQLYDLSFSEIIRLQICFSTILAVSSMYPDFKPGIDLQDFFDMAKKTDPKNLDRAEILQSISKVYFEARKAVEFRMQKTHKK